MNKKLQSSPLKTIASSTLLKLRETFSFYKNVFTLVPKKTEGEFAPSKRITCSIFLWLHKTFSFYKSVFCNSCLTILLHRQVE